MTTPPSPRQEITQLLIDWRGGDGQALDRLFPLVEPELHRLAHHYMSRERAGHTLQTTAVLNEAYLRLVDDTKPPTGAQPGSIDLGREVASIRRAQSRAAVLKRAPRAP